MPAAKTMRTVESTVPAKRKYKKGSTAPSVSSFREFQDQTQTSFQVKFQFLDGLRNREERKKSRSHVTAQHYRRKRFEAARRQDPKHKSHSNLPNSQDVQSDREVTRLDAAHWYSKQTDLETVHDIEIPILFLQGSSRADPFNSFPIEASQEVHQLVDHFCYVIPSLVHKHWSRAIRRPRSCWDLYNLYRKDTVSFLAMLHHSAIHLAILRGCTQTMQTIRYKQLALRATNQRLQTSSSPYDDAILVAVGLLANGERLWGNRETAKMHWGALKRMMATRGGFAGFKDNPTMHTKVLWSFIALSWPTSEDGDDEFAKLVDTVPEFADIPNGTKFRMSCDEFTQLINQRKQQMSRTCCGSHESDRWSSFVSNASSALEIVDTGYLHPDKVQSIENCRMACLVFLNLIFADHGESSDATAAFFHQLMVTIEHEDDDSTMTSEHLLWTLLASPIFPDHYERCWKVARLMTVAKKLSTETWRQLEDILRLFLMMPADSARSAVLLSAWDSEAFVEEANGSLIDRNDRYEFTPRVIQPCPDDCQICRLRRMR